MEFRRLLRGLVLCAMMILLLFFARNPAKASGSVYYVSSSAGNDSYDGLSAGSPFRTITKVNSLNLLPGDSVLFFCGDVWRADPLVLKSSGTSESMIRLDSYPHGCANQPVFSGSQQISGWSVYSGNIYSTNLDAGANTGKFPLGINQLFRGGVRQTMGRWPNITEADGGYSTIDAQPSGKVFSDAQLPAGDWTGAVVHVKNFRWSMVNRLVASSGPSSLTLGATVSCLTGSCAGWGYFLNNHLSTLDRDGEWFYKSANRTVYLYSASGIPSDIEGSVVMDASESSVQGGIMLSDGSAVSYVSVQNIAIRNWFNNGVGTPSAMNRDIFHHIELRDLSIADVDGAGISLGSWLWNPSDGVDGFRGGDHMMISNVTIDGANHFGITGYFTESLLEETTLRNIGLIANLNASGMGCGTTAGECTEEGDGLRILTHLPQNSGYGNTIQYNHFEKTAYNAIDVFGHNNIFAYNVITQACFAKGDCGGVRTFGRDSYGATPVYDLQFTNNIITNIQGNTDGCHPDYRPLFGMGLYFDNYSRNVAATGNTIADVTFTGILYQSSTGTATSNTVYNASSGTMYAGQVSLGGDGTQVSLSNNVLFALATNAWTMYGYALSNFAASDFNYLFHPYVANQIAYGPSWTRYTFSGWKAFSGKEANSKANWFTWPVGSQAQSRILINDTKTTKSYDLGARKYRTLDQVSLQGSVVINPFSSLVLIDDGPAALSLTAILPSIWGASDPRDFLLTVKGTGFTPSSSVRWGGAAKPTVYIDSMTLRATISASDVDAIAEIPITVFDPTLLPDETPPILFRVVSQVFNVFLPLIDKNA